MFKYLAMEWTDQGMPIPLNDEMKLSSLELRLKELNDYVTLKHKRKNPIIASQEGLDVYLQMKGGQSLFVNLKRIENNPAHYSGYENGALMIELKDITYHVFISDGK
jgi:hypothetical protein